jgi:hypothetical protein
LAPCHLRHGSCAVTFHACQAGGLRAEIVPPKIAHTAGRHSLCPLLTRNSAAVWAFGKPAIETMFRE